MSASSTETKSAVVTGAGSGIGRAVAVAVAREGWRVALVGRRSAALQETAALIASARASAATLVCPCDIADPDAVRQMAARVLGEFGHVDALVNSAGLNTKKRALRELSDEDYRAIIAANMHGAYYCAQAFLPGMREAKRGTIINISSVSGIRASVVAGAAYAMSKFGMNALTQAINMEERVNGIRACIIFPGDVNTPLLDQRPNPPPAEARARMLSPEDLAACVMLALNLPPHAVIEELVIRPM